MKLYKLTNSNARTYNDTQWGAGVTHKASGEGQLCGPGWLHAYTDPLLAVLLNPIHANFEEPRMWESEGQVGITNHGLKVGCTTLTTVREIPLPNITVEEKVRFGILCALKVYKDESFVTWAKNWLIRANRTEAATVVAETMAKAVAKATVTETTRVAAMAAVAAAMAAAMMATLRTLLNAELKVAISAARAAEAAKWAATKDNNIDLISLAHAALSDKQG